MGCGCKKGVSTMTDKPVIVRLASGAEYGLKSAADAKRIYPNGVIVRNQDGTPYEETVAASEAKPVSKMNRDELEAHAVKVGVVNPGEFANVGELRDAIAEVNDA